MDPLALHVSEGFNIDYNIYKSAMCRIKLFIYRTYLLYMLSLCAYF